jgi:hypothetical protein
MEGLRTLFPTLEKSHSPGRLLLLQNEFVANEFAMA